MLTRQRSQSDHHPDRQLILPNDRLAIVMVGLPARGKSFMAKKIYRYLQHLQIITKVFNFGSYRRIATKNTTVGKASASFFDPDNKQGAKIRRQCCIEALHDLISWYNTGGQIGILDATNTTLDRRKLIREYFKSKKSELEYNVSILHVESICNDEAIIHHNIISVKLKNPDYCTVDAKQAIKDFKERIKMYKKAYVEVGKVEGSYIKVIDVGTEVKGYMIDDYVSCRIFYFLMHLHLHRLSKTPKKPLLMQLKNYFDTKKDNEMASRLKEISGSVGAKFIRPAYDRPVPALAPHMRRASYLMWTESEDTYKSSPYSRAISNKVDIPVKPKSMTNKSASYSNTQTTMKSMTNSTNSSVKVSPLKVDKNSLIRKINSKHSSPIKIGASVTATTPLPTQTPLTNGLQSPNPNGSYIRQRPKVRKSTLIHKMVCTRDIVPITNFQSNTSMDSVSQSGYKSDNEEDSDDLYEHKHNKKPKKKKKISDKYKKIDKKHIISDSDNNNILMHKPGKTVSPIIENGHNKYEYKSSDIDGIDEINENESVDFSIINDETDSDNDDFNCELCGRTVKKKDTSLVEKIGYDNEKVRICEVCLYESESEDDCNEMNAYNSVEMMNFMHSQPISIFQSRDGSPNGLGNSYNDEFTFDNPLNQLGNVQQKVQEMENSVNIMLSKMGNENDKKFKQELISLQQKMQRLFQ